MDVSSAADIRDIKGPLIIPSKVMFVIKIALIVLAIAAFFLLIKFLINKLKKKPVLIPKTPQEKAYERLDALKEKGLIEAGKIKELYSELSNIIRYYIEERFELRAPEMTTEEFWGKLKEARMLKYEQRNLLKDFLDQCDLVKFAKHKPEKRDIDRSFEAAKKFIDETRPEVVEPSEETEKAAV